MKTVFLGFLTFSHDQHIELTGKINALSILNTSIVPFISVKN